MEGPQSTAIKAASPQMSRLYMPARTEYTLLEQVFDLLCDHQAVTQTASPGAASPAAAGAAAGVVGAAPNGGTTR